MRKCSRLPSGWPLANARVRGRPGAARAGVRRACRVTRPTRKHPHGGLIDRCADARGRRAIRMMSRRGSKGPTNFVLEAMKVTTALLKTPSETEKDQQHTPRSRLRHSSPSPPPLVAPFALPLHRRIIPSSHRRILHAVPSSHRLIFTSSHRRTPSTMPHRLIVPSSRLLIIPSSNTINNASSSHRLIDSSTHRHIASASHHLIVARHQQCPIAWSTGRLVASCVVCVRARRARAYVFARVLPCAIGSGGCAFVL